VLAATAAAEHGQPSRRGPARTVVIFHTHSASADWVERATRARMESLKEQHGWQSILWKDTAAACRVAQSLPRLSELAAGCVDDHYIRQSMDLFTGGKLKVRPFPPVPVGRKNWHWLNCDAGWLTYLKREWASFEAYEFFWLIEHDLGWTGSFGAFLRAFDHKRHDLLCPNLSKKANYHQGDRVNRSLYRGMRIVHCEQAMVRVSRRLLRTALDTLGNTGHGAFCELRLPCTCEYRKKWCTMENLRSKETSRLFAPSVFEADSLITPEELAAHPAAKANQTLMFHRVKTCREVLEVLARVKGNVNRSRALTSHNCSRARGRPADPDVPHGKGERSSRPKPVPKLVPEVGRK